MTSADLILGIAAAIAAAILAALVILAWPAVWAGCARIRVRRLP